jgi:hypothetical protein
LRYDGAVAENRIFVSSELVDRWLSAGTADFRGEKLEARGTGTSYLVEEAVHITAEVTGSAEVPELVGRVRPLRELSSLGAEILDRSMVLGDLAYDIVPGFLVAPHGLEPSDTAFLALSSLSDEASHSDEDLLARYLIEKLE